MVKKTHKKIRGAVGLTVDEVQRIFELRASGKTPFAIHKITGHHRATVDKYLKQSVPGHPQTPVDERVQKLRTQMMEVQEFDLKQSLLGDLVLIDEYRDKMAERVASGAIPLECDASELKKIIDAKATIVRLPKEIGAKQNDIYEQIRERVQQAEENGMMTTDFTVLGERATDDLVDGEEGENRGAEGIQGLG